MTSDPRRCSIHLQRTAEHAPMKLHKRHPLGPARCPRQVACPQGHPARDGPRGAAPAPAPRRVVPGSVAGAPRHAPRRHADTSSTSGPRPPWPPCGPAARPARRSRLRGAPAWGGSPACVAAGSSGATPAGSVQRACRRCNGSPPAAAPPGPRHPSPSGRQCESGSPPAGRRPAPPRPAPRSSATAGSAGSPSPPRWRWWRPSPPPSPTLSPPPSPTLSPAGSAAPGSPIP